VSLTLREHFMDPHLQPRGDTRIRAILRSVLRRALPHALGRRIKCVHRRHAAKLSADASWQKKLSRYRHLNGLTDDDDHQSALSRLRAYAHSLDKGLHKANWVPGHSACIYRQAKSIADVWERASEPTYVWACSILREYESRQVEQSTSIASRGQAVVPCSIPAHSLLEFLQTRRSSRQYVERPVTQEHVQAIVSAALEAPSSSNRQTLRVYATIEPEKALEVGQNFHGFTGFSSYVPAMLVFAVDIRPYQFPAELFIPTLDTGLAVENAALMAFSLGLSMTQLIWVARPELDLNLRSYFGIPHYEDIIVGAACGFPERDAVRPARKTVTDTLVLK